MVIPPVPQLPAQHPSAPFCQITCGVGVGVGLDGVLLPQDETELAPVAKRTATIPDIRHFIIFSPWEIQKAHETTNAGRIGAARSLDTPSQRTVREGNAGARASRHAGDHPKCRVKLPSCQSVQRREKRLEMLPLQSNRVTHSVDEGDAAGATRDI